MLRLEKARDQENDDLHDRDPHGLGVVALDARLKQQTLGLQEYTGREKATVARPDQLTMLELTLA
jgi:hypothetical protein